MTTDDKELLAGRFAEHRARLIAMAYRMLGSLAEAEDAVQEAWLRLSRADAAEIENLGGWLTTVVGRVCLDMLRSRRRGARSRSRHVPDPSSARRRRPRARGGAGRLGRPRPARRARHALARRAARVRAARPVRRAVRRDRRRSSAAPRRRRGSSPAGPGAGCGARPRPRTPTSPRQRHVVDAFLAAARGGDFDALLAVLDPDVELRVDEGPALPGPARARRGGRGAVGDLRARAAAASRARCSSTARAGVLETVAGRPVALLAFTVRGGRIAAHRHPHRPGPARPPRPGAVRELALRGAGGEGDAGRRRRGRDHDLDPVRGAAAPPYGRRRSSPWMTMRCGPSASPEPSWEWPGPRDRIMLAKPPLLPERPRS